MSTTDDFAICGVDRALDRLRVAMKRTIGRLAVDATDCPEPSHLLVVHAVEEGPPTDQEEVTVGMVAERLGVDPSRASRLVAGAIRSGLVRRVASQEDGRRSRLELTELGQRLADRGRHLRLELVAHAMAGWDDAEQKEFARLFERFADGLSAVGGLTTGTDCLGYRAASEQAVPETAERAGPGR